MYFNSCVFGVKQTPKIYKSKARKLAEKNTHTQFKAPRAKKKRKSFKNLWYRNEENKSSL